MIPNGRKGVVAIEHEPAIPAMPGTVTCKTMQMLGRQSVTVAYTRCSPLSASAFGG